MSQMETKTTRCSDSGHPEFELEFNSEIPQADVKALVGFLEESVQSGCRYKNGETIQFGSMTLRVVQAGGYFKLQEPDQVKTPIAWNDGVTQSLRLLRLQKDIAEGLGLDDELDFPSILQSLVTGVDLSEADEELVLERLASAGSDSGWFLGKLDSNLDFDEPSNMSRVSVYEAILKWPSIAGFLALPTGTRVDISSNGAKVARDGKQLEIQKSSLLGRWNQRCKRE